MSKRKVYACKLNAPVFSATHEAKVHYDSDYREYVVSFLCNGVKLSDSNYYTDDKEDAIGTARRHLFEIGKQQVAVCTTFGTFPSA